MECNKDEALRAKELAEKKMQDNDFVGAQKVALKAQRLYPLLENISQLLTVCSVHCSAQISTAGSEKDWYGILQIDKKADEVTIKKQYRRLALVLHPDKNKFPGAEAAFKLIGEANMVLCDPAKRAMYDNKCKFLSKATTAKRPAQNYPVRPNNNIRNGFTSHPQTQPTAAPPETFWTGCPFCNTTYQYYKTLVNRALRCQKCTKPFIAYDLGSQGQGAPLGAKWSHPTVPLRADANQPHQQNAVPNQGTTSRTAADGAAQKGSKRSSKTHAEVHREKASQASEEDVKAKGKDEKHDKEMPKVNKKSRKRSQKQRVESSESIGTASSTESEAVDFEDPTADGSRHRKSSRMRQHVSYDEDACDDKNDSASPLKKARAGNDSSKQKKKEAVSGDDGCKSGAKATQNGTAPDVHDKNGQAVGQSPSKVEPDTESCDVPPPTLYECPDPEFNDFAKLKEKSCFAADQIWACYDTADGMPRFYCQIRKVAFSPEFSVRYTWLEAYPEDKGCIKWVNEELPAGCGRFRRGDSGDEKNDLMFSHPVQWEKGKRGQFIVYPKKGQTWALFKDWDIGWSSDPDKHSSDYKYEIVEVLSDFVAGTGITVSHLDKVSGFVSLFQSTKGGSSFLVKSNELYKFSHQIPSFKMSGTEKSGVPEGSFELDPASLPQNPDDVWYPGKVTSEDSTSAKHEYLTSENVTTTPKKKSADLEGSGAAAATPKKTPKKSVDLEGMGAAADGESSKVRRSPRGVNVSMTKKL